MITLAELLKIMPHAGANAAKYLSHLNDAMREYEIDTPNREAMFLAQIAHESGELRYAAEIWGPTVAPTGTTSYTTSDSVVWIYVGVPAGTDIAGTVCAEGHARFDPLGYIAAAYATLSSAVGYDEKWMFLSIGQTDKTISTVSADFTTAYINVTNYFLARGIKCALGFTCYAATTGADAWYTSNLLPGYVNALANYSGNVNVVTGANLRSALGILTVSPASGAGLQSDQLHMNDPALNLASEAWYSALIATGRF